MFGKRYRRAVLEIVERVKKYTPGIGKYCNHSFDRESQIIVRLTNGKLLMPVEAAVKQDSLPHSLHEDWIETIAATFENATLAEARVSGF